MTVCKTCGKVINEEEDLAFTVNSGLESEYVECEACHDSAWEHNSIILCEACGNWFTTDVLHSENLEDLNRSFVPCPVCGKDIDEGMTREEMNAEYAPEKYIAIIRYIRGGSRAYIIYANDTNEMMQKLLKRADMRFVSGIDFCEVLTDADILK